eukprot:756596-Hanusia_phi.AAC.3
MRPQCTHFHVEPASELLMMFPLVPSFLLTQMPTSQLGPATHRLRRSSRIGRRSRAQELNMTGRT